MRVFQGATQSAFFTVFSWETQRKASLHEGRTKKSRPRFREALPSNQHLTVCHIASVGPEVKENIRDVIRINFGNIGWMTGYSMFAQLSCRN